MLSVILYGRNDDHGHNYHKRLAISINCIAEVLTEHEDEIVFADYNSADDQGTIIEAIQDTLTEKAKFCLRILRIRSTHHRLFNTPLGLVEPVARNVAIRRSNPKNRWILSTNPDMIFLVSGCSLSNVVSEIPDGFYQLPRFELPENLWELALDRMNPKANLQFLNDQQFQLNCTVRTPGFLQYDNPGDFQLMLREDIFQIGGFDERMTQGWHVDANLAKRMSLIRPNQQYLEGCVRCFHCNHTLKGSEVHKRKQTENNWNFFVNNKSLSPEIDNKNWGLESEHIEEIALGSVHVDTLKSIIQRKNVETRELIFDISSYNHRAYSSARIFPFLADHLCHILLSTDVAYIGHNPQMFHLIEAYMTARKFTGRLQKSLGENRGSNNRLYIFDFGFEEGATPEGQNTKIKGVLKTFFQLVAQENNSGAKVIGINVLNTDIKTVFERHLATRTCSFITGIAYGSLVKRRVSRKKRLLSSMHYVVVRYFFNHADKLRSLLTRMNILRYIKKT